MRFRTFGAYTISAGCFFVSVVLMCRFGVRCIDRLETYLSKKKNLMAMTMSVGMMLLNLWPPPGKLLTGNLNRRNNEGSNKVMRIW